MPAIILDSIVNAATYFAGQWTPELKLNQSRDVLRLVLNKLYGVSQGNLFHARVRCSDAALAAGVGLSREWTCTLKGRLRDAGWIVTDAPRLPDGKQEVTTFRPGPRLKRLLVMLLKSREKNRVNGSSQKIPTKEEMEKNRRLLGELIADVALKMGNRGKQRRY